MEAMDPSESVDFAPFDVAVRQREGRTVVVALSGELDLGSAPQFRKCLAELARIGAIHLVIDLSELTFLDATGISLLVTDYKRSSKAGGRLVVRNARPRVMRVFEITGLVELLSVTALVATNGRADRG
jgi:anti-sigma B factor antagonist